MFIFIVYPELETFMLDTHDPNRLISISAEGPFVFSQNCMFIYCFSVPTGLEDVSKYVELISALYSTGQWTVEDLKKLVGLNFLRVFREVEKVGV